MENQEEKEEEHINHQEQKEEQPQPESETPASPEPRPEIYNSSKKSNLAKFIIPIILVLLIVFLGAVMLRKRK